MPFKSLLSLALVVLLLLVVALPTGAQDGPSDLTPSMAPPVTPEASAMVVGLPFGEAFDSNMGWVTAGAWQFDLDTAYSGGGWFLDGTWRATVSTLEYASLIDLSGALSAQLVYRQKGNLPDSDLIGIDLSLSGGLSWIPIDQQIGITTPEWEQRFVDLTDYRGQIVRLRFRINTGVMPAEEPPAESDEEAPDDAEDIELAPLPPGYWLDNLTIQFVAAPDVAQFVPIDTGPRTLMGLHLVVGASRNPVIDLVKRLHAIGWPIGTVKGTSGTESLLNEIAAISPETVIIYRSLETAYGRLDCPNVHNDPVAEAQRWMGGLQPYWYSVLADYYEIMNECHPPGEWLAPFAIEAMRLATAQGQCLLLFSFGPGNPEPGEFAKLLPVFQAALAAPCQPGRYHGIALHAYGLERQTLVSESGIYLGFRHRMLMTSILTQLPEAMQIPVYITEAGPGDGRMPNLFRCEDITRDVMQYTSQLEYDPYVRGFELWNVGPPSEWIDVTPCLSMIGDALINYYAAR
jgi:hypothetical protein